MTPAPLVPLADVLRALRAHHGRVPPPPVVDPFGLVVWEIAAYLVPDARRAEVFEQLAREVGTRPSDLLDAGIDAIAVAIERGGMHPRRRAEKLVRAAEIATDLGDLAAIARGPLAAARRALKRFPGIGAPGADRILLLCGAHPVFTLESNGLRVLQRVGFGTEGASYAATLRSVLDAVADQLPARRDGLVGAHLLLRRHGQTVCRNTRPECGACPLSGSCAHAVG